MNPRVNIQVDLNAVVHNYHRVKTFAPHSKVLAMVKSNAYGHGLIQVANALVMADALGVANITEAIQLRKAGIKQPIVVMAGFINLDELKQITEYNLTPVIHHAYQISILESSPHNDSIDVWLKIDTGMHRLGLLANEISHAYQRLLDCSSVREPIVLMTHLCDADLPINNSVILQLEGFKRAIHKLDGLTCIANSAGIVGWPLSHGEWVRPGIMLYGVSPIAGKSYSEFGLQSVMTVRSRLLAVRNLPKGSKIGYGSTWICPEAMPIGVISFGYGNGYPRHARNGTPILVNGIECPLVGRVSMDLITVDLRNYPEAKVGDLVELWGKQLAVERVAAHADTIAYEILCNVGCRAEVIEKA